MCLFKLDFIDSRFWSLVGVPYPVLPSPTLPLTQQRLESKEDQIGWSTGDGNGNSNGAELNGVASTFAKPTPTTNAPPEFDAQSDLHVAYDLILSDGQYQLKALLSPTLAIHLEKGGLLQFGLIEVTESSIRYDETVVAGPGFYVIKQLNIIAEQMSDLILADPSVPLSFPSWVSASDQLNKPLIGGPRSYYLSLFNDDTIFFDPTNYPLQGEAERIDAEQKQLFGRSFEQESKQPSLSPSSAAVAPLPMLTQESRLEEPRMLMKADVITIRELLNKGFGYQHGDKSIGQEESIKAKPIEIRIRHKVFCSLFVWHLLCFVFPFFLWLLVFPVCRVFAKSRILNFGRSPTSKGDMLRSPFSFELLVGDESNEQIKVVLWNTLVGAYFHRIHIGQLVAIRGFRLKHARSDNQFELALNPYHPIGSIRLLEGAYSVEQSVGEHIPPITMTVSTIAIIKTMPDDSVRIMRNDNYKRSRCRSQ